MKKAIGSEAQDQDIGFRPRPVRPDFIPVEDYTSREFARLENERLWPRVWLIAAREQQFQKTGDFVRFDIGSDRIVIVRKEDGSLAAFYNVCQHRGRLLVDAPSGNIGDHFTCKYHAWRYDLDGATRYIHHHDDWSSCPTFGEEQVSLKSVRLDTWGGWVWVTMDPQSKPLREFLAPAPELLAPFEFENLRITWYNTVRVRCNWKAAIEAFDEAYHVAGTHPQAARSGAAAVPKAPAVRVGDHSVIRIDRNNRMTSNRVAGDPRQRMLEAIREQASTLHALYTDHYLRAVERLAVEVPADANLGLELKRLHREEMENAGARWPADLTDEIINKAGDTWHFFPNTVVLASYNGALWYRARPDGLDHEYCYFDIWWLGRHAPGEEPPVRHDVYASPEAFGDVNFFLSQDFSNMEQVQEGMSSRGFNGARTNPVQETAVSHLHEVLHAYLFGDAEKPEA